MVRIYQCYYSGEVGPELTLYQGISDWLGALTVEERTQLDELPLRQDTISLLTYLRDHRTTGTQFTGNLPLKAIREAAASFVSLPAEVACLHHHKARERLAPSSGKRAILI